jgi:MFS family permease
MVAARLGGLPPAFWYVWSGTLVNRVGSFVQPFLVLYLTRERGLPVATAGLVLALYGGGALVSQPIGGALADRIGRRSTMVLGLSLTSACLLGLGSARGAVALGLLAVATGVAGDLYRPAVNALIADLVPPADRTRAFGLVFWAINLGFAIAAALAGFLAELGYELLFAADAATTLAFAVLVARRVPETGRRARGAPRERGGVASLLRDRLLVAVTLLTLVSACIYFQAYTTLPLQMTADGLPPSVYGLVIALNGVVIVLVQPFVAGLLGRLPRMAVLAGAHVLLAVGFGATGLAVSVQAYAATVVVWTLGEIANATVGTALIADIAPIDRRGRAMGLYGAAFGAAAVLAPAGGTALFQVGGGVLWMACTAAGLGAAAAFLALTPAVRARAAGSDVTQEAYE